VSESAKADEESPSFNWSAMSRAGPQPTRAACNAAVAATAVRSALREATLRAARSIAEVRYARLRTARGFGIFRDLVE
jgi:hypothetical protein